MRIIALLMAALLTLTGCAHVESTHTTFHREGDGPVVLKLERHVEEILTGPDIEEDQSLVLELRRVEIGKRLTIPSDAVTVRFTVARFGPSSEGDRYRGYIIVKTVSEKQILARLQLEVTARTGTGSYVQKARFHGDYTFSRESAND